MPDERSLLRNLALMATAMLVGLILAEAALRLFFLIAPTPADAEYRSDPYAGYRYRPGSRIDYEKGPISYINSFGFRDQEHSLAKPERTFRILGIGDSFVYGLVEKRGDVFVLTQRQDHFLVIAGETLERQVGRNSCKVEPVMLGLPGYSLRNEVGVLRSMGLSLSPDLVLLNLFVGNDITGIALQPVVLHGQMYYTNSPNPWLRFMRRFYTYLLVEKIIIAPIRQWDPRKIMFWRHQGAAGTDTHESPTASPEEPSGHDGFTPYYLHSESKNLATFLRKPDANTAPLWRQAEEYLREFDQRCDSARVPWALVLIPADIQVDRDLRLRVLERLSVPAEQYDFDAPQARLRALAASLGVPTLDLLSIFRQEPDEGSSLYITNDIHWSLAGNHKAGQALGEFLAGHMASLVAARCP